MGRETRSALLSSPGHNVNGNEKEILLWGVFMVHSTCVLHIYANFLVQLTLMSYSVLKLESKGNLGFSLSEELQEKIRSHGQTPVFVFPAGLVSEDTL